MSTVNKYLLQNQISDESFNNASSKEYLVEKLTGGQCCSGQNVFKYTVQKLNNNQKTLYGDVMMGGRVSLPSQYFGNAKATPYASNQPVVKTSSMTPTLARQALPQTFFTGGSKMSTVKSWLKKSVGGHALTQNHQNDLVKSYQANMDTFLQNVKTLSGGKKISKNTINKAFAQLKN